MEILTLNQRMQKDQTQSNSVNHFSQECVRDALSWGLRQISHTETWQYAKVAGCWHSCANVTDTHFCLLYVYQS